MSEFELNEQHENNVVDVVAVEKPNIDTIQESNIDTIQHENNVVDVVAVEKHNNITNIPPTEVSVSYSVYRKFNEMLEQMIPNHKERTEKRQQIIDQVFLRGINNISNSIQHHQQQHCFFVVNGKSPRPDTLENYTKLAYVLENGVNFPNYGEKFLRNIIQRTLNVFDDRTIKKYFHGLLQYSTKISYASGYNVQSFCEAFSDFDKSKASQNLDDHVKF